MFLVTLLVAVHILSRTVLSTESHWANIQALQACVDYGPLGMITGAILDWQISASSVYPSDWDRSCHEKYGRLYQSKGFGWCARYKTSSEWLQVDLGVLAKVTGVMTQGRGDVTEWVTSFMISYSLDAFNWKYAIDLYGNHKIFEGNMDSNSVKHSYFESPIVARFVKFNVLDWHRHPSMRVEIIGCQACRNVISMPPYVVISASSERSFSNGSSCRADDAFLVTKKAWCAKYETAEEWLQFDLGPPTLVTGLVTKGRGDTGKRQWVTRYRVSYSNNSVNWIHYKDASYLKPKEFIGNVDKHIERYHYLNSPFIARYVRFHPIEWQRLICMRAGLIGCPYRGKCLLGFMRLNDFTPCVENLAFQKESWVNGKRHNKRHVRNEWKRGLAGRAVDGDAKSHFNSCTLLDNSMVDRPTLMIDFGSTRRVSGLIIVMWNEEATSGGDQLGKSLDRLDVYVDKYRGRRSYDQPNNLCGSLQRLSVVDHPNKLHIQCNRPTHARYLYIVTDGAINRIVRQFSAALCEVMVYG